MGNTSTKENRQGFLGFNVQKSFPYLCFEMQVFYFLILITKEKKFQHKHRLFFLSLILFSQYALSSPLLIEKVADGNVFSEIIHHSRGLFNFNIWLGLRDLSAWFDASNHTLHIALPQPKPLICRHSNILGDNCCVLKLWDKPDGKKFFSSMFRISIY